VCAESQVVCYGCTPCCIRGLPSPLHSSVHQVPLLVKAQCMLFRNLGYPLKTSVQMPFRQQNFSAH
jgi:hypothetical protein